MYHSYRFIWFVLAVVLPTGPVAPAAADDMAKKPAGFPVRSVTMIVPYGVGGGSDQLSRAMAAAVGLRLAIDATGFLHGDGMMPEKSWRQLDPEHMLHAFTVNAVGPALLMKHFLPLLPRDGKSLFATLSTRIGSIGDNRLGGWYSYRASKAALNQLVRTASIELKRRQPEAICVALHPGTVDSALSAPFDKANLKVRTPLQAADKLLKVMDHLTSGQFFDYGGDALPW